jgi:hypothetical protein
MSVYLSSFSGNDDEDEMDTGFRQVLAIMITSVANVYFQWRPEEGSQTRVG